MTARMTAGRVPTEIDYAEIMRRLPHRYPFLLVDRAEDFVPSTSIIGIKSVTLNEPFFPGHFPVDPVMPGVLIVEAMAQTGAVLMSKSLDVDVEGKTIMFMSIDDVRFRKPVRPGDLLRMQVEVITRARRHLQVPRRDHGRRQAGRRGRVRRHGGRRQAGRRMSRSTRPPSSTPGAELADGVEIGPCCIVGPGVTLDAGVRLVAMWWSSRTRRVGARTVIHPFAVLGGAPQHTGYKGEPVRLVIGADNVDPRALHHEPRHAAGRRRHPRRLGRPVHDRRPRRPRLRRRRQCDPGQQRHPGRPRRRSATTSSWAACAPCTRTAASGRAPSSAVWRR